MSLYTGRLYTGPLYAVLYAGWLQESGAGAPRDVTAGLDRRALTIMHGFGVLTPTTRLHRWGQGDDPSPGPFTRMGSRLRRWVGGVVGQDQPDIVLQGALVGQRQRFQRRIRLGVIDADHRHHRSIQSVCWYAHA